MEWPALEQRVIGVITGGESFETVLGAVVRYQARHVPGLARFWARRGFDPDGPFDAASIPAVPTETFRRARLVSGESEPVAVFRTSGTTSGRRGEHVRLSLAAYDASAWRHACRMLPLREERPVILPLVFDPGAAGDSSLTHMVTRFRERLAPPRAPWALGPEGVRPEALREGLGLARRCGRPVLLLATTFALADALESGFLERLPPGSRIVSTGGFKGRRRVVDAAVLREALVEVTGVSAVRQHVEYGMTEWSSQLWSSEAVDASFTPQSRGLQAPGWARVSVVDPETLEPCGEGEEGLVRMVDLANVETVVAVQTSDRGYLRDGRLFLCGRREGAMPRGCSLAVEELERPAGES
ncbi:MAG: acyl-protein synthetase [Deltaproteobacteria bacterium]|nr:MAG: acyl-protein synthetase [Deltaproteobacteria bacterium]